MKKLLFLSVFFLYSTLFGCATCQLMTPTAEVQLRLNIQDNKLKTIPTTWVFSQMYVHSLLVQYDANRDEKLDEAELLEVKKAMLDYLQENHMLTQVEFTSNTAEEDALILKPKFSNFSLKFIEDILHFSYDINLDLTLQNEASLYLVFKDEQNFFDFTVSEFTLNSKRFNSQNNLYLFTASILFKDIQIEKTDETEAIAIPVKETLKTVKKTLIEEEKTNDLKALQTNLLQESIEKVKTLFESIKDEKNPLTYISLLLFAYLYGFIHALGPGHGKTLVASYFLSNERSFTKALSVSLAIGVVHTFSAFLLTLIIYFGVSTFLSQFMQDSVYLTTKISALIIISIALYLIYKKYKAYKLNTQQNTQKFSFSTQPHVESCACSSCKVDNNSTDAALIISAGIIPCPGTTTIFIFAISLGLYYAGFLAALVMSLGMSSVIYISALISVSVRKKTAQKNEKLKKYLEYISLVIILILGVLLLLV